MADKNYKSYELLGGIAVRDVVLRPENPADWNDTMKVWKCWGTYFERFEVLGSTEDCVDVGQASSFCTFDKFVVEPTGKYGFTIKGGSDHNNFFNITFRGHGRDVDIEIGNWHSFNFDRSKHNFFNRVKAVDGRPVTYCYRLGCKPTFFASDVKHLWWRSIGLTVYWWAKYIWHRVLGRPDNF
jgi:hypothetical protein